jgi:hypothetical protein
VVATHAFGLDVRNLDQQPVFPKLATRPAASAAVAFTHLLLFRLLEGLAVTTPLRAFLVERQTTRPGL